MVQLMISSIMLCLKTACTTVIALFLSHLFVYTVYNIYIFCSGAGGKGMNKEQAVQLRGYSSTRCARLYQAIRQVGFNWPNHFFTDQTCHVQASNTHGVTL